MYFTYHAVQGERGLGESIALSYQIETMSQKAIDFKAEREALEKKVFMMRPGSVDLDLLEQQAKLSLGFAYEGEVQIFSQN